MNLIYKQNDNTSMYVWKQTIHTRSGIIHCKAWNANPINGKKEEGEWAATVWYICIYILYFTY